ncbi:MAG: hypothetical protein ABFC78_06635 [Methanoregula sp.]
MANITPVTNVSLAAFALTTSDLPAGFNIETSRQKSADEISTLAKDLGWQQGYVTVYTFPSNNTNGSSMITQTITVYPKEKMPGVVSLINTNERQQTGLNFLNMPLPATGPDTYAFSAEDTNKTTEPATTENKIGGSPDTKESAPGEGYFEVIFYKGDILEVIRMSGAGAHYDTLKTLAETAYAKLE